jgi:hypothetical protein
VIPALTDFESHYNAIVGWHKEYEIRNLKGKETFFNGSYKCLALYELITYLSYSWEKGNETDGMLAADILFSLKIEWI